MIYSKLSVLAIDNAGHIRRSTIQSYGEKTMPLALLGADHQRFCPSERPKVSLIVGFAFPPLPHVLGVSIPSACLLRQAFYALA